MSEYQVTPEQEKKWREEFEEFCNTGSFEECGYPDFGTWKSARAIDAQRIAELEAQVTVMQWRPIETAPKDGTMILVCNEGENLYSPTSAVWASYHPNAEGKKCWRTSRICGDKLNPTHWMPLSTMPMLAAAKRKGE